jgi:hypothetical protein
MFTQEISLALDASANESLPWNVRLVPSEPSLAMIKAAVECQDADPEDGPECEMYYAYLAMLAAAPRQEVPMLPVGYLVRTATGDIAHFSEKPQSATGCLPPGWSEEPVFTSCSAGVPLKEVSAPKLPEMSPGLLKTMCEGLLDENPVLTQEHTEEIAKLLATVYPGNHSIGCE